MTRARSLSFIALLVAILTLAPRSSFACQCPVTSLSMDECNKYEVIFKGKVVSVTLNDAKSVATFEVQELYKGNSYARFNVIFDNTDACKLEFHQGDEWIIYTNYYQIESGKLDFCSRSRKFIGNLREDFFYANTNVTFDEELKFLQTNLGLHKLLKENPNKVENRNIIPSKTQFVITLICSLLGIILFYWLFNKFFK